MPRPQVGGAPPQASPPLSGSVAAAPRCVVGRQASSTSFWRLWELVKKICSTTVNSSSFSSLMSVHVVVIVSPRIIHDTEQEQSSLVVGCVSLVLQSSISAALLADFYGRRLNAPFSRFFWQNAKPPFRATRLIL